jgi:hypothetical protein
MNRRQTCLGSGQVTIDGPSPAMYAAEGKTFKERCPYCAKMVKTRVITQRAIGVSQKVVVFSRHTESTTP